MASKSKKKTSSKPNPKPQGDTGNLDIVDISSLAFFRGIAQSVLMAAGYDPDKSKEFDWKVGELATQLMLKVTLIAKHYKAMDRLADSQKLSVSWSVVIDRTVTPSVVEVKGSFGEKHKMKAKSDAPDPNAMELPGLSREEIRGETHSDEESPEGSPESGFAG